MRSRLLGLFILLLGLSACQERGDGFETTAAGNGIVGGVEVAETDAEARMAVALINQASGEICTGTLITENIVLTAAHCVVLHVKGESIMTNYLIPAQPNDLMVAFGTKPFSEDVETRAIRSFRIHENYKGSGKGDDLAVLRLDEKAPAGTAIARLPVTDELNSLEAVFFTAVGYGRTNGKIDKRAVDANGELLPREDAGEGVLRKVEMRATVSFGYFSAFTAAQKDGRGVCFGDSGGPALKTQNNRSIVIGVASAVLTDDSANIDAENYDSCSYASIYTNVFTYKRWITDTIKALMK